MEIPQEKGERQYIIQLYIALEGKASLPKDDFITKTINGRNHHSEAFPLLLLEQISFIKAA